MEITFVAPSHRKDKIHKFGHMHLDDVVERAGRFQNELVIASHFSTRYKDRQIEHHVKKALPGMLDGRLAAVALKNWSAFGHSLSYCLLPAADCRPPNFAQTAGQWAAGSARPKVFLRSHVEYAVGGHRTRPDLRAQPHLARTSLPGPRQDPQAFTRAPRRPCRRPPGSSPRFPLRVVGPIAVGRSRRPGSGSRPAIGDVKQSVGDGDRG